jgi:hypothetical protein
MSLFPSLEGFGPTKETLHNYSHAVGVIPRAHGIAHPRWWHISLKVRPDGLVTDNIPLPGGGALSLRMDLVQHQIVLATSHGHRREFSLAAGLTGTQMGDQIIAAAAEFGLKGTYARDKFESDARREYDTEMARRYFSVLVNVDNTLKKHKATLRGELGPVQIWPHGFDLAFEWFGTRVETHEEHGQVQEFPAQLNLGFYPGSNDAETYFYSNPWPFEGDVLLNHTLPAGAKWHTEGWQGSMLPYAELVDVPDAEARLLEYARRVYDLAAPTLMA